MIKRRLAAVIFFITYLLSVVYLTFFIGFRHEGNHHYQKKYNIALFRRNVDFTKLKPNAIMAYYIDIIGNILLFVPLMPLLVFARGKNISWGMSIVICLSGTIAIEASQLLFDLGICDIDDVVLNFTGGILGRLMVVFLYKKDNA